MTPKKALGIEFALNPQCENDLEKMFCRNREFSPGTRVTSSGKIDGWV